MAEGHAQRCLAAILAADVVGYSRLMEADEAGPMAMLITRRKQVLEPLVARHQGRVFNVVGSDLDGDGVNVAAQLASLAEPGGILISENLHDRPSASTQSSAIPSADKSRRSKGGI